MHAAVKRYLEPHSGSHEVKIGPYIADIVGEDGIIEIQTGNFDRLRAKLSVFLTVARVTVAYPIPRTRRNEDHICYSTCSIANLAG